MAPSGRTTPAWHVSTRLHQQGSRHGNTRDVSQGGRVFPPRPAIYLPLRFSFFATFAMLSTSVLRKTPNSSGRLPIPVDPVWRRRFRTSGEFSAVTTALRIVVMISLGVLAGTSRPFQRLNS